MKKVSSEEILKEIWENSGEYFISAIVTKNWNHVRYSFARFTTDMAVSELIVDQRTLKGKWDILEAKGVLRDVGKSRYRDASLNLWALTPYMSSSAKKALDDTGRDVTGFVSPYSPIRGESERDTHIEEVA